MASKKPRELNPTQRSIHKRMPLAHRIRIFSRFWPIKSVLDFYSKLTPSEKCEFIKARFFEHPRAKDIAKAIARITPAYDTRIIPILEEVGFEYEVREVSIERQLYELRLAQKRKASQKEIDEKKRILDLSVLSWFKRSNPEEKLQILRNRLFGANPELFIDDIFAVYKETNNPEYLYRFFGFVDIYKGLGKNTMEIAIQKGYLKDLVMAGFFPYLIRRYPQQLADLGFIADIIRDGSQIKALVNIDIHSTRKYLKMVAQLPEGISALIRNGFTKELFESVPESTIRKAIGDKMYLKLKRRI